MKRLIFIALVLLLLASALAGCGQSEPVASGDKISVVATIFPQYDFVREVAGDHVDLTMLLPPGAESHSFEPTPQDITKIQNCDVFIYVGGDSDEWIKGILESIDTSKMKIISLIDMVDVVEEEIVEGMEEEHGHDHDHEFDPDDVKDRSLVDWEGSWKSVLPFLKDSSLDEFIEHTAEENKATEADTKASYEAKWQTDYQNININGDTVSFDGQAAARYTYVGYEIVESDHGASVWYQFQIAESTKGMPAYLAFSDHHIGNEEKEHEDEDHEEGVAHFHLRYGNDSLAALMDMEEWTPTFFDTSATGEDIAAVLSSHGHEEEAEYDEHVWTSPKNAKIIVQGISDVLCEADDANASIYKENTSSYLTKLDELDAAFKAAVEAGVRKTLVFGDRFPFRYFADAYGLDYFAAFPGCSTETEPSAATVAFLIDEVKTENIPVVFHIELSNEKMVNTICEATNAKKLLLHACHNISKSDFEKGVSYVDLMTANVEAIKEALK